MPSQKPITAAEQTQVIWNSSEKWSDRYLHALRVEAVGETLKALPEVIRLENLKKTARKT